MINKRSTKSAKEGNVQRKIEKETKEVKIKKTNTRKIRLIALMDQGTRRKDVNRTSFGQIVTNSPTNQHSSEAVAWTVI